MILAVLEFRHGWMQRRTRIMRIALTSTCYLTVFKILSHKRTWAFLSNCTGDVIGLMTIPFFDTIDSHFALSAYPRKMICAVLGA